MAKHCFAPSVVLNKHLLGEKELNRVLSKFGGLAETFIGRKYLSHVGRPAFFPAAKAFKDFQDVSVGFGNVELYKKFLQVHHPGIEPVIDALQKVSGPIFGKGMIRVPDLLTNDGLRREFYEIKPNSSHGIADGLEKMAGLGAFYDLAGLPYKPGKIWNPDEAHTIFSGDIWGSRAKVSFHFFRHVPGLIVYDVCVEADVGMMILTAIAAVVILNLVRVAVIAAPKPIPV